MIIEDFNHIINFWLKELEHYDFNQICIKPSPTRWSLGQMYMHLIDDTKFYMEQIKICLSIPDHSNEEASPAAKKMFRNNDFPDEAIEGSPANAFMLQPDNKEHLMNELLKIRAEMNDLAILISKSTSQGKTKHPGLNYFSASEWLQFAEMHFRHHIRQKKRIDDFLKLK